jgi:AbrB family looped-hinge helix DNA binding protein
MAEATLSTKNQIAVPHEVRQALGLKPGDKPLMVVHDGCVVILPKPKSFAKALRGSARGVYPKDYLKKERANWD